MTWKRVAVLTGVAVADLYPGPPPPLLVPDPLPLKPSMAALAPGQLMQARRGAVPQPVRLRQAPQGLIQAHPSLLPKEQLAKARKLAAELGASVVLAGPPADLVQGVAKAIGATPLEPPRGLPWLLDGVGIVYDIVGSATSLETAIRLVHSGGRVVVAGVGIPKRFEWTPIYFKEVTVVGSNAFGFEPYHGEKRHAIDIYLELANQGLSLGHLVTHRFPLAEWRDAFTTLGNKRKTGAVKVVFDFDMDA